MNYVILQVALGSFMEQVILHLQLVNVKNKQITLSRDVIKELKDFSNRVLKTITMWMLPSSYFKCITQLLEHTDRNVKKKVAFMINIPVQLCLIHI